MIWILRAPVEEGIYENYVEIVKETNRGVQSA